MPFKIEFDRVLSVGINYVGTRAELNGCINDVINLKKEIKTKSHVIMTEISQDVSLIPTRANIINQIKKFVANAKPGENLLFQYSGHGSYMRDNDGDEDDHRDETICPLDYARSGDIKDDQLKKIMVDPLPAGCKLWCIFDCCHSGTIMDLKYNCKVNGRGKKGQKGKKGKKGKRNWKKKINQKYADTNCQVICFSGCLDKQTSADAWEEGQYQGAMTWGLIKTVNTLNKRGVAVTYKNVMKNLLKLMKARRYTQIPQISAGHNLNLDNQLWS